MNSPVMIKKAGQLELENLEKIKREYERLKKEVGKEKPKIRSKSKVIINSKDK